jgi:hypothetical protein
VATALATAGLTMAAPAALAHDENLLPTICGSSSYFIVNDSGGINGKAKRRVQTEGGATWGYVYLLYSNSTERNCVVTRKAATWHGAASRTVAELYLQNDSNSPYRDAGPFEHYADVQREAGGVCVRYFGFVWDTSLTIVASGGRFTYGNCN